MSLLLHTDIDRQTDRQIDGCYLLSYVIFIAKMSLFDLTLPIPLTLAHNKDISNNVIFALKLHNFANDT